MRVETRRQRRVQLKVVEFLMLLLFVAVGFFTAVAPSAEAQNNLPDAQSRLWQAAMTPAEQARYTQQLKDERTGIEGTIRNAQSAGNPIAHVDAFVRQNELSISGQTRILTRDFEKFRATTPAALANPTRDIGERRVFINRLVWRDAAIWALPKIPAAKAAAAKHAADLKLAAAAKAAQGPAPISQAAAAAAEEDRIYRQMLTFRAALSTSEQTRSTNARVLETLQMERSMNALLGPQPTTAQVAEFAKTNSNRLMALQAALTAGLPATKATFPAAHANQGAQIASRQPYIDSFTEWDMRRLLVRTIDVYRDDASKRAGASRAFPGAQSTTTASTPASLSSLPGYLPQDAVAFAQCTSDVSRCMNTCTLARARTPDPRGQTCQQFCAPSYDSCVTHIRWNTYERPMNSSNPLTKFYTNQADLEKDPNYRTAHQTWMRCLYEKTNNSDMEETGRCQRLRPINAYRP